MFSLTMMLFPALMVTAAMADLLPKGPPLLPIIPHHHYDHFTYPRYAFDYGVSDPHTGDHKSQWEARDGDFVKGAYSLMEPDGTIRVVEYESEPHKGFNAIVKKIGHAIHPKPILEKPIFTKPHIFKPILEKPLLVKKFFEKPIFSKPFLGKPLFEKPLFSKPIFPLFAKPLLSKPLLSKPQLFKTENIVYPEAIPHRPFLDALFHPITTLFKPNSAHVI